MSLPAPPSPSAPPSPAAPAPSVGRRVLAGVVLLAALAAGAGVAAADLTDALPDRVDDAPAYSRAGDPAAADVGEAERAGAGTAACPTVGDGEEPARLMVASATDGDSEVTFQRYGENQSEARSPEQVGADAPMVIDLDPEQAAAPLGFRWRGEPALGAWLVGNPPTAAASCEPYPYPVWHVIGFDTTLESEATLHLLNPFSVDAVVRVTFGTPDGRSALARTENVLVGAGQHRTLDVTDLEPEHPELAATVEVLAGRMVAQGEMVWGTTDQETGPEGRALLRAVPAFSPPDDADDLGDDAEGTEEVAGAEDADAPGETIGTSLMAATGARTAEDATSWLVVYNLTDREASFELSVTDANPDAPRLMSETGVPAGGVVRVDLAEVSTAGEFGVAIEPVGEARLAATRITAVTTSAGGQDISVTPLQPTGERWALAGAEAGRGRVTVANLGDAPARVDVDAGEATPPEWTGRQIEAGAAARFELADVAGEGPLPLRIDADGPVTAGLTRREGGSDLTLWSLAATNLATWEATPRPPARRDPSLPGRLTPRDSAEDDDTDPFGP